MLIKCLRMKGNEKKKDRLYQSATILKPWAGEHNWFLTKMQSSARIPRALVFM